MYELICLHQLHESRCHMRFDGLISIRDESYFVQALPVNELRIKQCNHSAVTTFIKSSLHEGAVEHHVWLQLQGPFHAYERFHTPFVWIAQLTGYVIDYLDRSERLVGLRDFQSDFGTRLREEKSRQHAFVQWF